MIESPAGTTDAASSSTAVVAVLERDAPDPVVAAEPVLTCPVCAGVVVGVPATAFTAARAQLILANGYCRTGCSATPGPVVTAGSAT